MELVTRVTILVGVHDCTEFGKSEESLDTKRILTLLFVGELLKYFPSIVRS